VNPRQPLAEVAAEVAAEARALEDEPGFPRPFVERVRSATARLGVDAPSPGDVRHAALILHRQASVELEPPLVGRDPLRRAVKRLVRRLVGWYVRVVGAQVNALGLATARLGLAVADRTESLEAAQAADRADVHAALEALQARVAHLEAVLDARGGDGVHPGSDVR
jgi:hypothetical protein